MQCRVRTCTCKPADATHHARMLMLICLQARTYEEMVAEAAEAEAEAAPSDSDEEDEFVYNPLKLPLGYDGKPIPFWLYKLHGLNQVSHHHPAWANEHSNW